MRSMRREARAASEPCSREAGFTLIRLLVTFAIVGILIAAASPNIATVNRIYDVRSGARQVFSELQNARMAAVMANLSYTFTVQPDGVSYTVQPSGGTVVTTAVETPGITISAPNAITFASNGTASQTANVTVTGSTGSTIQVAVASAGRIRIQ